MGMKLMVAPTGLAVPVATIKAQVRDPANAEDALITMYVKAATEEAEVKTGRAILTQTWRKTLDAFPDAVMLFKPPAASIVSVQYLDESNQLQTLAAPSYVLDNESEPAWLLPAWGYSWPATAPVANAVRITYVCGYGADDTAVPEAIKNWITMRAAGRFNAREDHVTGTIVTPTPFMDGLLDPYRVRVIP